MITKQPVIVVEGLPNIWYNIIKKTGGIIVVVCKKCNSSNVTVQAVTEIKKKRKGVLYWLFIGWWLEMIMWVFLTLPWLIIKIFKPKEYKNKITSMAVCQDCGYSWRV